MCKTKGLDSGVLLLILDLKKKKKAPGWCQDFIPANEHLDLRGILSYITISFSSVPMHVAKSKFAIWKSKGIGIAAMACLPRSDRSLSESQTQPQAGS